MQLHGIYRSASPMRPSRRWGWGAGEGAVQGGEGREEVAPGSHAPSTGTLCIVP